MKLFDEMTSLRLDTTRNFAETTERQNELWREVARLKEQDEQERAIPLRIVDTINILRHAKIGRLERGYAYDEEEYDPAACAIAGGVRDREKQDTFYIGVSKTGTVCSRPNELREENIVRAIERSIKLSSVLSRLLKEGP